MHPVVEQILAFFARLFRNALLTGRHRFLAGLNPGTVTTDQAALVALVENVRTAYLGSRFNDNDYLQQAAFDITKAVHERNNEELPFPLLEAMYSAVFDIFNINFFLLSITEPTEGWEQNLDFKEEQELKRQMHQRMHFFDNAGRLFPEASEKLVDLFENIIKAIPSLPDDDADHSTLHLEAPLFTLMNNAAHTIEKTITTLINKDISDDKLFHDTREQLWHNIKLASGYDPCHGGSFDPCKCRLPTEQKGKSDEQLLRSYLASTPFFDFFNASIPIPVPEEVRFEHMHIVAGSGHGKTQALQHLIVNDLQRPADEVPAMVILDSQGDMLRKLQRLALFDPTVEESLARRLLIVDPSDVEFAPSLNLFDIQSDRLKDYSQKDREQVLAGIIEIYDYIFGGLLGAELTQKQSMVFRFLAQLMLAIPGATIHTLRDLLIDASPYREYIATLPGTARSFFETQFFERNYNATREQILRRLYGVLQNTSFERMFASPQNRLDLFPVLNEGGIVLVNTAKDFMKTEASSIFGRYIIALTFKAAMERAILPEHKRRPTFLYIDEAAEYFDDNIDSLLIQARKYKLGLIMAHQYLGQLPRGLPASMMTNTSIKLAGGTSDKDARELAREMRTTPEFITGITKERNQTSFAAYVRNITPQAMKLTIPFGTAEEMPRMSDESFEMLLNTSRKRLSPQPVEQSQNEQNLDLSPVPIETIPVSDDDELWQPFKAP